MGIDRSCPWMTAADRDLGHVRTAGLEPLTHDLQAKFVKTARPRSEPASPAWWLRHLGEDGGIQFGRSCPAGDLRSDRRSCRRPDDQIGLGQIDPGIGQAGDETELPRIACRSGTGEDQGSLV